MGKFVERMLWQVRFLGEHDVVIKRNQVIQVRVDRSNVGSRNGDKIGKGSGGLEKSEKGEEGE